MVVEVPVKGYFGENCFFYIDERTKHGFVIDPGAQGRALLNFIEKKGWTIEKILLTHGHFDHTGAVDMLRRQLRIPVLAHRRSVEYLSDPRKNLSAFCGRPAAVSEVEYFDEGDVLSLEADPSRALRVLYTPGHTPDSVIFYSKTDQVAFVGDTIFKGSIGNDQYPGGDRQELIRSITGRIFTLPEETVLCSGHSEQTTVGEEKRRYGL